MTQDEIIKQIIAIGLSLSIKEIDYNKAVEITKQTLIEHEKLVKNLAIHDVGKCNELLKVKHKPTIVDLRNQLTKAHDEYSDGKLTDAKWLRHTSFIKGKISALLNL